MSRRQNFPDGVVVEGGLTIQDGDPWRLLVIQWEVGAGAEVDLALEQMVLAVHHDRFLLVLSESELKVSRLNKPLVL